MYQVGINKGITYLVEAMFSHWTLQTKRPYTVDGSCRICGACSGQNDDRNPVCRMQTKVINKCPKF